MRDNRVHHHPSIFAFRSLRSPSRYSNPPSIVHSPDVVLISASSIHHVLRPSSFRIPSVHVRLLSPLPSPSMPLLTLSSLANLTKTTLKRSLSPTLIPIRPLPVLHPSSNPNPATLLARPTLRVCLVRLVRMGRAINLERRRARRAGEA